MYSYRLLALLPIVVPYFLWGQVQLLSDPNQSTQTLGSEVSALTIFQGNLYAYAESEDQKGLWRLDTLTQSMELVRAGFVINEMVATDSLLIFVAYNYDYGLELWRSDGTEAGTEKYFETFVGRGSVPIFNLQVNLDQVYFTREVSFSSKELWRTDGTQAGTYSIHNIVWRGIQANIGELASLDSLTYFWGTDSQGDLGIFQTDGSVVGTSLRYSDPNWASAGPHHLVGLDSLLYFWDDQFSPELWQIRKDTVVKLVKAHKQFFDYTQIYKVVKFQDYHYFVSGNQGVAVTDSIFLWRTNGDFNQVEKVFSSAGQELPVGLFANEQILYLLYRTVQGQFGILKTDGVSLDPPYIDFLYTLNTVGGVLLDSVLVFATRPNFGDLISTDGTSSGTLNLGGFGISRNFHTGDLNALLYQEEIYLAGTGVNNTFFDRELYQTDGQSISLVDNINEVPVSANISSLIPFQNKLIFTCRGDGLGQEPWVTSGTAATTQNLFDIRADSSFGVPSSSVPLNFTPLANELYFQATDTSINGLSNTYKKLWQTNGSALGTEQTVNYLWTGSNIDRTYSNLAPWQNQLYFAAAKADPLMVPDVELYTYDPVSDTATLVADVWLGPQGSEPRNLIPMDSYLFFTAYTLDHGRELWRTDGTSAGTQMVKDIYPGTRGGFDNPNPGRPASFIKIESILYFTADGGINGWALWRSDGTAAGTYQVQDTSSYYRPANLHRVGDKVLFTDYSSSTGTEPWVSDGTTSGTTNLVDGFPGMENSDVYFLYEDDNIAFFSFYRTDIGFELWKTDGSANGTELVKDLVTGPTSSSPSAFTKITNDLYAFFAIQADGNRVLWTTDGTSAGTEIFSTYSPSGDALFEEKALQYFDGKLYFVASSLANGESLYQLDLDGLSLEPLTGPSILLFPNPTNGLIKIQLEGDPLSFQNIELFNLQGQSVYVVPPPSTATKAFEISLPKTIARGHYLLRIISTEGVITKPLILK